MKKEQKYGYSYQVNEEKRVVTCIYTSNDGKWIGLAKCDPEDNWDEEFGKELARKRAVLKANKERIACLRYPDYMIKRIIDDYYRMINDFERQDTLETNNLNIEQEINEMIESRK